MRHKHIPIEHKPKEIKNRRAHSAGRKTGLNHSYQSDQSNQKSKSNQNNQKGKIGIFAGGKTSERHKKEAETYGFTLSDALSAYKMGGEDPEDLRIICEMYRLSSEDTKKAFELCGVEYPDEEAEHIDSG